MTGCDERSVVHVYYIVEEEEEEEEEEEDKYACVSVVLLFVCMLEMKQQSINCMPSVFYKEKTHSSSHCPLTRSVVRCTAEQLTAFVQ